MFAQCPDCKGQIVPGVTHAIIIPVVDDEGWPLVDSDTGELLKMTLQLPAHRAFYRDDLSGSEWDPTGLAPSNCNHGLPIPEHPLGRRAPSWALSWIRARYMSYNPLKTCPVCRGEPAPEDLVTPRALA